MGSSRTPAILKKYRPELLSDWLQNLIDDLGHDHKISESEVSNQANEFLNLLQRAASNSGIEDVDNEEYRTVREFLDDFRNLERIKDSVPRKLPLSSFHSKDRCLNVSARNWAETRKVWLKRFGTQRN